MLMSPTSTHVIEERKKLSYKWKELLSPPHVQSYAYILFQPVDGMYAAAGEQPCAGIMCCVITRTLL